MSMSKDNRGGDRGVNGPWAHCDGEVAVNAIRHLVESGKISVEDAKLAIESGRAANNKSKVPLENNASSNKLVVGKTSGRERAVEKPKSEEKYRTRHVALQFSYDGTDFTGFAQNVGKEYDNSVEKALFAALEKTRLLVSPDEQGMLVMNNDEELVLADQEGMGDAADTSISARTASKYSRCGRTDKGVHARCQVVALYLKSAFPLKAQHARGTLDDDDDDVVVAAVQLLEEDALPKNSLDGIKCLVPVKQTSKGTGSNDAKQSSTFQQKVITEYDYPRILNNVLPPAIRILGWCPVSSEFSARFSCSCRTYRYFFPRRNLNLADMALGLEYMMGRKDFRNMAKMNCEQVYNFERVLVKGKVVSPQRVYITSMEDDTRIHVCGPIAHASPHDMCHVEIIGQAFLWHQIRCIMSILFYIGRQVESPEIVKQLLDVETNPAKPSYDMASETALVLHHCQFNNLSFGRTVRNLWDVTKVLEKQWEIHAVAAERARDALDAMKEESEVRWTDVVQFIVQINESRLKKKKERKGTNKIEVDHDIRLKVDSYRPRPQTNMISWASAIHVIQAVLGVYPYPSNGSSQDQKGQTESTLHVPIMERSKGTTYEEKVQSILGEGNGTKSSKRKNRYEENVIKKRKTNEEDQAFYTHMLQQGGSSG